MIAEIILAALVAFGLGAYAGKDVGTKEERAKRITLEKKQPEVWPPVDHKEMLKVCAFACGRENVKSYDVMYGRCECKDK